MRIQNKRMIMENRGNSISIYGDISDYENSPIYLQEMLKEIDIEKPVSLNIASYGGDVNCGLAMYNMLKEIKDLTVHIQGFCFSIATVIAMAGKKIVMEKGSLFLIHKPLCATVGNADDLKDTIEMLDKTEESILDIYENFSNVSREELKEIMAEEKAFNGTDASRIFKNIVVLEDDFYSSGVSNKKDTEDEIEKEKALDDALKNLKVAIELV